MCPECGYHTQKKERIDPVLLDNIGAVRIVTADGFGGGAPSGTTNTKRML